MRLIFIIFYIITLISTTVSADQNKIFSTIPYIVSRKNIDTLKIKCNVPDGYEKCIVYARGTNQEWKFYKSQIIQETVVEIDLGEQNSELIEYMLSFQNSNSVAYNIYTHGGKIKPFEIVSKFPRDRNKKVLLLIDKNLKIELEDEIITLKKDLITEGYDVILKTTIYTSNYDDVEYKADVINNKSIIQSCQGLTHCIIIGNVSVPYSGFQSPDNHLNHLGAWPMDYFYFSPNTANKSWTDSVDISPVDTNGSYPYGRNLNKPNDGKYDLSDVSGVSYYNSWPDPISIAFGRIQFKESDTSKSLSYYKSYFARNHAYRNGDIKIDKYINAYDDFEKNGIGFNFLRHIISSFDRNQYDIEQNQFLWRINLNDKNTLITYGSGSGNYMDSSLGSWEHNLNNKSQAYFNFIFGSYFGDWDNPKNYLKSFNYNRGLVTAWAGWGNLRLHNLTVGKSVGEIILTYQNNIQKDLPDYNPSNINSNYVYPTRPTTQILGDPTLTIYPKKFNDIKYSKIDNGEWVTYNVQYTQDPYSKHFLYTSYSLDGPYYLESSSWSSGIRVSWPSKKGFYKKYFMVKKYYKEISNGTEFFRFDKGVLLE